MSRYIYIYMPRFIIDLHIFIYVYMYIYIYTFNFLAKISIYIYIIIYDTPRNPSKSCICCSDMYPLLTQADIRELRGICLHAQMVCLITSLFDIVFFDTPTAACRISCRGVRFSMSVVHPR